MSLLRVMLIASAIGSVGYGTGLLFPGFYPIPEVAPEGEAWARYLMPIYLGLGAIAWLASRRPIEMIGVAWSFVLIWGGLVAGHLVNMWPGDEPVGAITLGLLAFDAAIRGVRRHRLGCLDRGGAGVLRRCRVVLVAPAPAFSLGSRSAA